MLLIPGGRFTPAFRPACGQRPGAHSPHAPTRAQGPTAGSSAAANRSGFPAGRAGWSSGWREKGKSLGSRRAGPAASRSRGRRAAGSLPAPFGRTQACQCGDPRLRSATSPRPRHPRSSPRRASQGCGLLAVCSPFCRPEDRREGRGTRGHAHRPRRARIAHSQPRAPVAARPTECGPAAGPGTCPPPALLRLRPARRPPQPAREPATSRQLARRGATGLGRQGSGTPAGGGKFPARPRQPCLHPPHQPPRLRLWVSAGT